MRLLKDTSPASDVIASKFADLEESQVKSKRISPYQSPQFQNGIASEGEVRYITAKESSCS